MTPAEYQGILESQSGVCGICKGPSGAKAFAVDHCHATNKIRGLLCMGCNTGLGMFRDQSERLRAALDYLERN